MARRQLLLQAQARDDVAKRPVQRLRRRVAAEHVECDGRKTKIMRQCLDVQQRTSPMAQAAVRRVDEELKDEGDLRATARDGGEPNEAQDRRFAFDHYLVKVLVRCCGALWQKAVQF